MHAEKIQYRLYIKCKNPFQKMNILYINK